MYFGQDVDVKIKEFSECPDREQKNQIFTEFIRPAFVKLIEAQMSVYRFYTIDDPDMLKNDCLSTLYELLPKYDFNKGKKAFSYFNVVTKNWFIWKIREKSKRLRNETDNVYGLDREITKDNPALVRQSHEDDVIEKEFWLSLYRSMDKWKPLLKKKQEIQVLEAVVFLLQNTGLISIYNRKAVYLYIREMTGLTTKQVMLHLKRLKELYLNFRSEFADGSEEENQWGDRDAQSAADL